MKKSFLKKAFLDKVPHFFPIAWCVELNKIVDANEVPNLQKYHSKELTFQCYECHEPFFFYLHELGIRAIPGFFQRRKSGDDPDLLTNHRDCLLAIFDKDLIPDILFSLQDFENAFFQNDILVQEISTTLRTLQDAVPALQQELSLETDSLEKALENTQKAFYLFDSQLARIAHVYKALRQQAKGF